MANTVSGVRISKGYVAQSRAPHATPANRGTRYGVNDRRSPPAGLGSPEAPFEKSSSLAPNASVSSTPNLLLAPPPQVNIVL